jgi:predicted Zn-ribbon and HTH transcriptional regulator
LDNDSADLDVPTWAMTRQVQVNAILRWLDGHWQARDLAFLLDRTKQWQRVKYEATDAVVFAKKTLRCAKCGWAGDATRTDRPACPKCSSELKQVEIFGNQEAAFPLDADARFVESRPKFWDHDHCLICDVAIGRDEPWGYRESSFAGGPNSVGLWLCERCFDRYLGRQDFSFLVRRSANS